MQTSTENFEVIYSVPISEPKSGESAVYRRPNTTWNLYPEEGIKTLQDIALRAVDKFANKNFCGTRNIVGQYEFKTYKQVFDSAKEAGSAILANNMFYHSNKEYQNFDLKFVGVMSKNRTEWAELEIANYLYNFTMVPLYDTMTPVQIEFVLEQTLISTLCCSDKCLDKVLAISKCFNLKYVVVFDEISCFDIVSQFAATKGLTLMTWNQLKQKGKQNIKEYIKVTPEDIFTLSYTSGTTGVSKAVMLTHKTFVATVASVNCSEFGCQDQNDVHLSYLPLSHIYERALFCQILFSGATIGFFCGDVTKLKDDLMDLKPTVFSTVPRILNRFYSVIQDIFNKKQGEEKIQLENAFKIKKENLHSGKQSVFTHPEFDDKFFKFTKAIFGGRVKKIQTAAAPISSEITDFFKVVLSCPVLEAYAQTEDIGSLFLTYSLDPHLKGTVGGPTPNTEFKILDVPEMNYFSTDKNAKGVVCPRGELLVKGCVMTAYFKNQKQSDETLDKDQFIHTGDIVELQQNGAIKIIDRRSNFFKLAQGEYVAPEKIENIYIRAEGVSEAFVYGDRNECHLVGVIVPNQEYVMKFASANKLEGDFVTLCKNPKIIQQILQNLNTQADKDELLGFEKVRNIYLEPVSFVTHGACTPSFKMKRKVAEQIFLNQLKELYGMHHNRK